MSATIISDAVSALEAVDAAIMASALAVPANAESHHRLAARLPALSTVEVVPPVSPLPVGGTVRVAAWNAERCKYIGPSRALIAASRADVVLLSEMDVGMARSGNRHTMRELAAADGAGFAFGVEFVELGLGDSREKLWHARETNLHSLHGNGMLTRHALAHASIIRLDDGGVWFTADMAGDQRRLGGRNAVAARLMGGRRPLWLVSVHLESHSSADDRAAQIRRLLDGLDEITHGEPALIGGDLNTGMMPAGRSLNSEEMAEIGRLEPLFDVLQGRGFTWTACNTGEVTQRTRPDGTPKPPFNRIDWFAVRGVAASNPQTLAAVDAQGNAISDHEMIVVDIEL